MTRSILVISFALLGLVLLKTSLLSHSRLRVLSTEESAQVVGGYEGDCIVEGWFVCNFDNTGDYCPCPEDGGPCNGGTAIVGDRGSIGDCQGTDGSGMTACVIVDRVLCSTKNFCPETGGDCEFDENEGTTICTSAPINQVPSWLTVYAPGGDPCLDSD